MFKSRSIAVHLLKGVVGGAFLTVALVYASQLGGWVILPLLAMLLCFRGCPMCWTVGLIETALDGNAGGGCADGSCATRPPFRRESSTDPGSPQLLP